MDNAEYNTRFPITNEVLETLKEEDDLIAGFALAIQVLMDKGYRQMAFMMLRELVDMMEGEYGEDTLDYAWTAVQEIITVFPVLGSLRATNGS
jgi:hypothetical protein